MCAFGIETQYEQTTTTDGGEGGEMQGLELVCCEEGGDARGEIRCAEVRRGEM